MHRIRPEINLVAPDNVAVMFLMVLPATVCTAKLPQNVDPVAFTADVTN